MTFRIERREFITLLGGACAWPLAARAQQAERTRRVGLLMPYPETDSEAQLRLTTFRQALASFGWSEGRDIHFDVRWTTGGPSGIGATAKELIAGTPDVVVAESTPATAALQRETRWLICGRLTHRSPAI